MYVLMSVYACVDVCLCVLIEVPYVPYCHFHSEHHAESHPPARLTNIPTASCTSYGREGRNGISWSERKAAAVSGRGEIGDWRRWGVDDGGIGNDGAK